MNVRSLIIQESIFIRLKNNYMTRNQYVKSIEFEIRKLNKRIDEKILHGQNYFFESLRHRFLINQLRKHQNKTLLTKLFPSFF